MLTASMIHKYGIVCTWDTYSSIDDLFSGSSNDPYVAADENASQIGAKYYDISLAISEGGKCITQVIAFKDRVGFDLYKHDGVLIFNHKEI